MGKAYGAIKAAAIAISGLCGFAPPLVAQATVATSGSSVKDAAEICVVVPHFKDEYWLSVGHGLIEEARVQNAGLLMFESGGYHALQRQISLLDTCVQSGAQAILLGAVSADDPALLAAVEKTARNTPVIALVNALQSSALSGAVGVDWTDMGEAIGSYLNARHPKNSPPKTAILVTGPKVSGWSPLLEHGLKRGLNGSSVKIVKVARSDTGVREQLAAIENALLAFPNADLIIGSAPAIEGAMGLAAFAEARFPELIATYISHSVRRGLKNGAVQAVAFDAPVEQGRLGIQVALSAKTNHHSQQLLGPEIQLITSEMATKTAIPLSPSGLDLGLE